MGIFKNLKSKFKKNESKNDEVVKQIKQVKEEEIVKKYEKGLKKSSESFTKKLKKLATKNRKIDEEYFNELEEILIYADLGAIYTLEIIEKLKEEARINNTKNASELNELIIEYFLQRYQKKSKKKKETLVDESELNIKKGELNIIIVIGVNGVGKTTSIGKLVKRLKDEDWKVSIAAADTFRAGAVKQLEEWANRTKTSITIPLKDGEDPSSVVYRSIQTAKEDGTEVLIIDTAGRLQNKENLMNQLEKMHKIIERESGKKAVENLLVLDATTGQNGVFQASSFNEVTKLTGIILTKMDSSSKGGIILSIKDSFDIPVKFIGLGEGLDDLEKFDIEKYLYGLTKELIEENEED